MTSSQFGLLTPETLPLFTDLYELTMLQGYVETGHEPRASFDLFFRDLPTDRGYVVAAGLPQVVDYVETLSFGPAAIDYLNDLGFSDAFLAYLESFEFTGEVRAVPEGTLVFPDEPLLEVTAPLPEAQLLETVVLNQLGFQSLVATKAARMRDVVERNGSDQSLVDFGSRRAHGVDAGVKAARAAYLGGFTGTSNVAAGRLFDVPVFGTMAHSWIQSFPTEREAFEAFVDVYGAESVLLVDTYDTVNGAKTAMAVAEAAGHPIAGVRLDSGDLVALSKRVAEFVGDTDVFVSSGMDEYEIESFLDDGGVADGFGPGTALVTSEDAPSLDLVYKLVAVEQDGDLQPSMKLSAGKATNPGEKRVHRIERGGEFQRDVLGLREEEIEGEPLLTTVFEDGQLVYDRPTLEESRERTLEQLHRLPVAYRELRAPATYPVGVSDELAATTRALREELTVQYRGG